MTKLHWEYLAAVKADDAVMSLIQAEPNHLHSQSGTELEA
jgi:hypothetical protein